MLGMGAERNLPTVLLIDDDLISREVVATLLTMNGYTLHTAQDGADALTMLRNGICEPEVILVDIQTAGLNGLELVRELRALSGAALYAICSGEPPETIAGSVDGVLQKPFVTGDLEKMLDKMTRRQPPPALRIAREPVIQEEILAQFRQVMPEPTVREVYTAVATDLRKRIPALELAIAAGNALEVRRIGHSIKGGCGMAGVRQASRLGAFFEEESDELNNSPALLEELRAALERLERMLEVAFSGQPT